MDDEQQWVFESAVINPKGLHVTVTIEVPATAVWGDVGESAEIAQICTSQAATRVVKMLRQAADQVPF